MERFKDINSFFDIIDDFNEKAINAIRNNEIEVAIDLYMLKIKFIGFAFDYKVISLDRAVIMTEDTKRLIKILS